MQRNVPSVVLVLSLLFGMSSLKSFSQNFHVATGTELERLIRIDKMPAYLDESEVFQISSYDRKDGNNDGKPFKDCAGPQQLELVDEIAYPGKAKPEMQQGVAFFNRLRSLVASGFFSSKMGIEDIGYVGNRPNQWQGVPPEIIKQYGLENVTFNPGPTV